MVYPFRWELHVSLANVEKVISSVCCSPHRKYSPFRLTLNPQLLSDRLSQHNRPSVFSICSHSYFLFTVRTNRKKESKDFTCLRWPRLPPYRAVREVFSHLWDQVEKLLTFKDQLSLNHFQHLAHIRLSTVTISGRCQPRGTLGN